MAASATKVTEYDFFVLSSRKIMHQDWQHSFIIVQRMRDPRNSFIHSFSFSFKFIFPSHIKGLCISYIFFIPPFIIAHAKYMHDAMELIYVESVQRNFLMTVADFPSTVDGRWHIVLYGAAYIYTIDESHMIFSHSPLMLDFLGASYFFRPIFLENLVIIELFL